MTWAVDRDRHPEIVNLSDKFNPGEKVTLEEYEKASKAEMDYLFHSVNSTLAWSSLPLMERG